MTPADVPSITSQNKEIKKMSRTELLSLFDWYDFKDPIGHKLTVCGDFIDLINAVTNPAL